MSEQNKSKKYDPLFHTWLFLAVFTTITSTTLGGTNFIGTAFAQEDKQKNIEIVEGYMATAFDDKDPAKAAEEYLADDFLSGGQIDKERAIEILEKIHEVLPDLVRTSEPAVSNSDGDLIVVFSIWNSSQGGTDGADLFKVQDEKIVEHTQLGKYPDNILALFDEDVNPNMSNSTGSE
ncbi:MAG: hypothetical protein ACPKPY_07915 [Nitrososphaeraceae archaeon]